MMQRCEDSVATNIWQQRGGRSAPWLAAAIYVALIVVVHPFQNVFEFDPDEGINMMKAILLDRGYQLYSQLWNDQPPVFTHLLRWWCRIFGWNATSGRLLVLIFAGGIVFAVYDVLRLTWGHQAAVAAAVLLPCTRYFQTLSVSIMLGLPAISLATLCVWAAVRWTVTNRQGWLLAAGVLMGLSLTTKLFTIFLLPILALWLVALTMLKGDRGAGWRLLAPSALWALAALLTVAGVALLCVPASAIYQLYGVHRSARALAFSEGGQGMAAIGEIVRSDWRVAVLAGLGTGLVLLRRRWRLLIAPLWCTSALLGLSIHAPVWYHHYLLLSVPAAMMAGVAVGEVFSPISRPQGSLESTLGTTIRVAALFMTVALAAALLGNQTYKTDQVDGWSDRDRFAVEVIKGYPKRSDIMVTGRLMYAVATGYEVPPNLAVISQKRLATGNLTPEEFTDTIQRENPEHVIFSWKLPEAFARRFAATTNDRYRLVYADLEEMKLRVFVRSDVAGDPLPALLHAAEQVPDVAAGHDAIGVEWARRGDAAHAIASFDRAHALDPTAVRPCQHLAEAHMARAEYAPGFAALRTGMQTDEASRYTAVARLYAWRRATCPDPAYRGGVEAEATVREVGRLAGQLTGADLETLAASSAAQGNFEAARVSAQRALEVARQSGQDRAVSRIVRELDSYRQSKAWIDPVQLPTS